MITANQLIEMLNPIELIGEKRDIQHIIQLNEKNTNAHALMWVNDKNIQLAPTITAGILICPTLHFQLQPNVWYIKVEDPRHAFKTMLSFFASKDKKTGIANSAIIHAKATIGNNVFIGENVVIEANCEIGNDVYIGHNTVILQHTMIGNSVTIGSNCTIGGVGFGYVYNNGYELMPHVGNVVIMDNVEIGNNTCIDRAVLGSTTLKEGVKVDNLVHIAHGVEIAAESLIIAHAMIAGSVKIGEKCWIAPGALIKNGIEIKNNVTVGLGAVVLKNVEENATVIGNPARNLSKEK